MVEKANVKFEEKVKRANNENKKFFFRILRNIKKIKTNTKDAEGIMLL